MGWEEIVGENIRRLRLSRGLTQDELAEAAGVAVRFLGGVERGQENPSLSVMGKIAAELGIHPRDLFEDPRRASE